MRLRSINNITEKSKKKPHQTIKSKKKLKIKKQIKKATKP